ncbi:LTA synthase family protein, partial [Pseudomonadota bacterium]
PKKLINLVFLLLLRVVFVLVFIGLVPEPPIDEFLRALYLGLKFDLRLSLIICLPVAILIWIPAWGRIENKRVLKVWGGYLAFVNVLVLLAYMIDFGHFSHLQRRMDATFLRYLEEAGVSLEVAWQSYPMALGVMVLLILAFLYLKLILLCGRRIVRTPERSISVAANMSIGVVAVSLYGLGLYGALAAKPLRWNQAFFSPNSFVSASALNPVLYFFGTLITRELGFDTNATRKHYQNVAKYLQVDNPDSQKLNFERKFEGEAKYNKPTNVIVVLLESFAATLTGAFKNPLDPSPELDRLANDGWLFRRFYAPHGGTARSVFALITGIPDIYTPRTAARNPTVVRQRTIVNAFDGYQKMYFLGGNMSWGNIRGLLKDNIPGIRVYEEGDYKSPRNDGWGITDLHLFEEANEVFKRVAKDGSFFAIIQTSGNHQPYTIPEDARGFKRKQMAESELKKYGFLSVENYNSFRFLDYSVGQFIRVARKESYFNNTLFVFLGDHGLMRPAPHMFPSEQALELGRLHVPMVFYAPAMIQKGKVIDSLVSEVDVLPTVAAFAGVPYVNTTLGLNVMDDRLNSNRVNFVISWHGNPSQLGIIGDKYYLRMYSDGTYPSLHDISSPTPLSDVSKNNTKLFDQYKQAAMGFFETSRYMLYHNGAQ